MTNQLQVGQRLNVNDKLVSLNGKYSLLMQTDGNLVLYQGDINASNAYWSTDTWRLPSNERPIYAVLQNDAQFCLHDVSEVVRWTSGSGSQDFITPYIILQDDGNLVIYHNGSQTIWASGANASQNQSPPVVRIGHLPFERIRIPTPIVTEPITPDLNTAIDHIGRLPAVVAGTANLSEPSTTTVDANGVAYQVTEQHCATVNDVIEQAFLQDIAAMGVWPGQVIQGQPLLAGDVASIGPFIRQPGKIQITTDLISNTPQPQSANLENPNVANVNQARWDILNAINPTDSPGLLKTSFERASTLKEVGVKLGVTVKGSAFGVDANANLNQTYKQNVVVASIRQVFYNVTFTPNSAGATGFWPAESVRYQDLEPYIGIGNPPLYIDSVQYGRFICITAQGAFSSSEITAALKVHWTAGVSGNVDIDVRTKEVLESCQIKIYTLGVPGRGNFQDITDPVNQLQEVFRSGLVFNLQNPGVPVSFTCRHIADSTLVHVGLSAEYMQPLSAQGVDISGQRFEVFDGRGGGLVDTGISVNPGDTVKVSASGLIGSGVIFSEPHGPEGCPGHRANSAAPKSDETAYCLVMRYGNGQWIAAKRFYEGAVAPTDGSGTLQLNINDNNPYNGQSDKRWQVLVDVHRAGATAAGIYV